MNGDTNRSGLVGNSPRNSLPNPPSSIGTELKALLKVELLHRFNQTHIPLLDQVKEQHAAAYITLRNADHESEVRFSKTPLCFLVPIFNALGQFNLIICRQQRYSADFLQVHSHRIIDLDSGR
ncbi:hypothetical protein D3C77_523620 [compost metagenome]